MGDLFSAANWSDFVHEEYFWPCLFFVLFLIGGVLALVYLDRYKRWQATRYERNKMRQWVKRKK